MTARRPSLARRALMEALGTFALVFAGCGAVVTDAEHDGALGPVGISLVFGLIISALPTAVRSASRPSWRSRPTSS
jgi:aquaporin Z